MDHLTKAISDTLNTSIPPVPPTPGSSQPVYKSSVADENLKEYLEATNLLTAEGLAKLDDEGLLESPDILAGFEPEEIKSIGIKLIDCKCILNLQAYWLENGCLPSWSMNPRDLNTSISKSAPCTTLLYPTMPPALAIEVISLSRIDNHKIPPFSGEWKDWKSWHRRTRSVLGNNKWLGVAEGNHPITSIW
jgi:hypothetical protein